MSKEESHGVSPADGRGADGARASSAHESSARVDLKKVGWLAGLLEAYAALHDPAEGVRTATEVLCAHPGEDGLALAQHLADRRLGGLRAASLPLQPALRARIAPGAGAGDLARAGVLAASWDVLVAVAALHHNESSREERKLELLAVMALGLEDMKLAQRLHDQHLERVRHHDETPVVIEAAAASLERRLASRHRQRVALQDHPVGVVLTHLEVRALAAIGSLYFERATIEEEGVARLHALTRAQKVGLIQVLTALAWADGKVSCQERRLIEHHVALAALPVKDARRLRKELERPVDAAALELEPLEPAARRFVLEQGILLSLVDDDLDAAEQALLEDVARRLGATPLELEQVMVEVTAFYEKNRDAVHDFGPVSGAFGRLRALVVERAQQAVLKNSRRILQEIKETGELARLLGAASVRPLTRDEGVKVRAQLLDICKTIPALAIFVLPGGALLLPVLLKVLPFNLLPTAFADELPRERAPDEAP